MVHEPPEWTAINNIWWVANMKQFSLYMHVYFFFIQTSLYVDLKDKI